MFTFAMKLITIDRCQLWNSLKYFSILRPMENDVGFEYGPWKMSGFVLVYVWVQFSHETVKFRFWMSLKYFIIWQNIYEVRFEYVSWKNGWFCFIFIFCIHFSHKLENFDFESHWNPLIFFDQQKMISDLNVPFSKSIWELV